MSDPISFAEAKWNRGGSNPASHSVRETLEVVLAKIDSGEIKAEHVIVILGTDPEDPEASGSNYFVGGPYKFHQQMGLIETVKLNIFGDARR